MPQLKDFYTKYYKFLTLEEIKEIFDTNGIKYSEYDNKYSLYEQLDELDNSVITESQLPRPIGYLIDFFKSKGVPDDVIKAKLENLGVDSDRFDEYYDEATEFMKLSDKPEELHEDVPVEIEEIPVEIEIPSEKKRKKRISREVPDTIVVSDDEQYYRDVEDVLLRNTGYEDINELMELSFMNYFTTVASTESAYHRYYMHVNYPFFDMEQIEKGREFLYLQSLYRIHECSMRMFVSICKLIQSNVDVETVEDYYNEKWGNNIEDDETRDHYRKAYNIIKLATTEEFLEYLLDQEDHILDAILDGIDKYESAKILKSVIESKIADRRYLAEEIAEVVRNIVNLQAGTLVLTGK